MTLDTKNPGTFTVSVLSNHTPVPLRDGVASSEATDRTTARVAIGPGSIARHTCTLASTDGSVFAMGQPMLFRRELWDGCGNAIHQPLVSVKLLESSHEVGAPVVAVEQQGALM